MAQISRNDPAEKEKSPSARAVAEFHKYSDLNTSPNAQHHSIGLGSNQVAPGRHYHNAQDSPFLLDTFTITGSRSGATATVLQQILIALTALGINDATTP